MHVFEEKTVGEKLKELKGESAEIENQSSFFPFSIQIFDLIEQKMKHSLGFWTIAFESALAVFQKKVRCKRNWKVLKRVKKAKFTFFFTFDRNFLSDAAKNRLPQPWFSNFPVHLLSNYMSDYLNGNWLGTTNWKVLRKKFKISSMRSVIRYFQKLLCSVCHFFVCTVWWWEKCETFCAVLTKNVNEAAKKRDGGGFFLMQSGQTDRRFFASICLVQYRLKLKVNGTAMKLTATKVRAVLLILVAVV